MGIGSGLGHSFGMVAESTYGTYVAPTRFVEGTAKLQKQKQTYQGGGMAAGRMVQPGGRRYVTTKGASGTIEGAVYSKGMGLLLNGLLGGTVAPVQQGATAAYLQTHALADPFGKFYTMQAAVPDLGGTARPYTMLGAQVTSLELSCEKGGGLAASWSVVGRDLSEAQTLAAPSYPTCNEFHFGQAALKLGTFSSEATVDGVRKVSVTIDRSRHDGGPYMGNQGLRSQGVINDWAKISGTIEADYLDKTVFADRFASDAPTALVWEFVGPLIASTYFETFRVKIPMIFFDGDTPTVDGPDVVKGSFPFAGQFDGTNAAVSVEYISTDLAL
ncbi:phage tail tube protein [Micromonospora sp. RTP1Z1]|uniref:phage tail tube protein n=1 Tax=Micromonospora sp. RTP1Z1 TaxID=2994043 RepID=UPI0029C6C677|nr:phage tail tube protein [Micromonospora sp. RTP1Z1]